MLLTYILWFLGVVCGLIAAVEIAIIIYRLYNKNNNVKKNIIVAVVMAVLSIGLSSSVAILVFDKIIKSNDKNLSEIVKEFGKASADITANAYQGFAETWDEKVKEKENDNK